MFEFADADATITNPPHHHQDGPVHTSPGVGCASAFVFRQEMRSTLGLCMDRFNAKERAWAVNKIYISLQLAFYFSSLLDTQNLQWDSFNTKNRNVQAFMLTR